MEGIQTAQGLAPTAPTPAPEGAAPQAPAPKERLSPQVQALIRKEQEAVRKLQQAKQLEAKLKAEQEAVAKQKSEIDAWNNKWKENPLKAVQERGLSPEQLWLMQQQGGQMTADVKIQMLQQELQQLRDERNSEKSEAQKAQEAQAEQKFAEEYEAFQKEISTHIETAGDKYPLLNLYKRADLVYSIIDRHAERTERETGTPKVLSLDEASKIVEDRLQAEYKKAQGVVLKTAIDPQQQAPDASLRSSRLREIKAPVEQKWEERPLKSLASVQSTVTPAPTNRYLTDEERTERAAARIRALKQARGIR